MAVMDRIWARHCYRARHHRSERRNPINTFASDPSHAGLLDHRCRIWLASSASWRPNGLAGGHPLRGDRRI